MALEQRFAAILPLAGTASTAIGDDGMGEWLRLLYKVLVRTDTQRQVQLYGYGWIG